MEPNPSANLGVDFSRFPASHGGRPPDAVDAPASFAPTATGFPSLERHSAPLPNDILSTAKKGRVETDTESGGLDESRLDADLDMPMEDGDNPNALRGMGRQPDPNDGQLKPSFRDTLVGKSGLQQSERKINELDVVVNDEDVLVGGDAILPEISFSAQVHDAIDEELSNSVIIRLLGKSIGYRALLNRIQALWSPIGELQLIDLDNEYFLVRFALEEDFTRMLIGGPWVIYGSYLTVQPWSKIFSTNVDHPGEIMAWVHLPKLPYRYYTKSLFRYIANAIGKVVRIDYNTDDGKIGRFARLAIIVNLNKPLISGIVIDGMRQDIEYEGLPSICFTCGKYGHLKEYCGKTMSRDASNVFREVRDPTEKYGPWMQDRGEEDMTMVDNRNVPHSPLADRIRPGVPLPRGKGLLNVSPRDEGCSNSIPADDGLASIVGPGEGSMELDVGTVNTMGGEDSGMEKERVRDVASDVVIVDSETSLNKTNHTANQTKPTSIQKVGRLVTKVKKKDDRGPRLGSRLSALVSDLDKAEVAEANRTKGIQNENVRWCENGNAKEFFITCVYASPCSSKRNCLWGQLKALEPSNQAPWVLGGDFNAICNASERQGGVVSRSGVSSSFCDFIFDSGVTDMGFNGPRFTWTRGSLSQRLDRFLCNGEWYNVFSKSEVFHLQQLGSDHRPLLLDADFCQTLKGRRPFKYLVAWNEHPDFENLLRTSWDNNRVFSMTVQNFQLKSKEWSITVFGHIERQKQSLLARIKGVEKALDRGRNSYLEVLGAGLKQELEVVLEQEESLWFQRARTKWINLGDRNTAFFHASTISHRRQNRIAMLQLPDGSWCDDQSVLQNHALEFFRDLLTSEPRQRPVREDTTSFVVSEELRCSNASRLWKGLSGIWGIIKDGLCWSVQDGSATGFWNDYWLDGEGKLATLCVAGSHTLPSLVASMVAENGDWNWSQICQWLSDDALAAIAAIKPPRPDAGADVPGWRWESNRNFTVRSAYKALSADTTTPLVAFSTNNSACWSRIWKLSVQQRVRIFLWLVLHQRIMTNVERKRRHLATSDVCASYQSEAETIIHVLRDCPRARQVWEAVVPSSQLVPFFSLSFSDWIMQCVRIIANIGLGDDRWPARFATICWLIWKQRCNVIFGTNTLRDSAWMRFVVQSVDGYFTILDRRNLQVDAGSRSRIRDLSWEVGGRVIVRNSSENRNIDIKTVDFGGGGAISERKAGVRVKKGRNKDKEK
ncbi:hypothetical protein GQ457_16G011860 [Hibiscus cannabinus]